VFVFGALLVGLSDDAWSFGDSWIWGLMVLYFVAIGLSRGFLRPNVRRMIALMEQPAAMGPPSDPSPAGDPRPGD
jgi:hypothetical protein